MAGRGAAASYTDTATTGSRMTTGEVQLSVTPGQGWLSPSYSNKEVSKKWKLSDPLTGVTPIGPGFTFADGFGLKSLENPPSHFEGVIPLTVKNIGSLGIHSLSLAVSNPGNTDAALESDTVVTVFDNFAPIWSGRLDTLTGANPPNPLATLGLLPVQAADLVIVVLTPAKQKYSKKDVKGAMGPEFLVTGSDA